MVQSIRSSDSINPYEERSSLQEKQKQFEIQFETAVLGIYISVSRQDGGLDQQLSRIKKGMDSKQSPDQLAQGLNQLIDQINQTIVPEKALFPPFQFTTQDGQAQALTSHATTLEKCLHTIAEKGIIQWNEQDKLFGELSSLINNVGRLSPEQAFNTLNDVIDKANCQLPSQYKFPNIPYLQGK